MKEIFRCIFALWVLLGVLSLSSNTIACQGGGSSQQEELGRLLLQGNYSNISCRYLGQPYSFEGNQAHAGIDYPAQVGISVYAPVTGVYSKATTDTGDGVGLYTILPNGKRLFLHHMQNRIDGHRDKGQKIGEIFNDHVHAELRINYSGTKLVGGIGGSCGSTTCTLEQIQNLTDDPSEVITESAGTIFFEDNFDGTSLDYSKWNNDHAVAGNRWCSSELNGAGSGVWLNYAAESCYGTQQATPYGEVSLSGGAVTFSSSNTRTFPFILTGPSARQSPFPTTGNFSFEVRLKFNQINGSGSGLKIRDWNETDPNGDNPPAELDGPLFQVWADSTSMRIWLSGQRIIVPKATDYHTYRLDYSSGAYSVYMDNSLIAGPTQSAIRPNSIWIGNPLAVYFASASWTNFTIDYIRVMDIPSSPSEASIISMITPILASKKVQAINTTRKYFEVLKSNARVGDILLFNACKDTAEEPVQCSSSVIEGLTIGLIQGVGYGYYQHAALIYKIEDKGFRVLQARGPGSGVGADENWDLITPASLVNHHYRMMSLVRVNNASETKSQQVVNSAYSLYNNSNYDSTFLPYNGKMYCSELVWDAYNRFADIDLSDTTIYPIGGMMLPDDISESSHTTPFMTLPIPAW